MKDDEIRKAFEKWWSTKITEDEARFSESEDELCFYAGYKSRDKELSKLSAIKQIMTGWESDRISFHDYDRLKEIEKVLTPTV